MTVSIQVKLWWLHRQPDAYFMQKNPPITDDFQEFVKNIPDHELRKIIEKIYEY
jgi:hypothetical protein